MSFLRSLLTSSLVRLFAMKEVRHLATSAAGFALAWLMAHHASQSDAANIAEGIGSLMVGGAGYGFSLLNGANNETRVQASAQASQVVSLADAKAILAQGESAQRAADEAQATKIGDAMATTEKVTAAKGFAGVIAADKKEDF